VTRKWLIAGTLALVALAAAGIAIARRPHKAAPAAVHNVEPASTDDAPLTGRVQPRTIVAVAAPIEGTIEAFYAEPGQEVIQGQLLGRIRSPKLAAAEQQARLDLDQAQARAAGIGNDQLAAKLEVSRAAADQSRAHAELDRLEKAYERQKGLWAAGATPRLTFEKAEKDAKDARAELETLDTVAKVAANRTEQLARDLEAVTQSIAERTAALDRAKADLNAGELHSPADGILLARHGDVGQPVDPSTDPSSKDLLQIATDLTALQVMITPPPMLLPRIQPGQAASVRVANSEYPGTVREVRGTEVAIDFTVPAAMTTLDLTAQVKIKF
jgi:HlyD family secretion protein